MKTLYVTDLDGTLLDKTSRVSDKTKCALKELYDRGVQISPATSRSWSALWALGGAQLRGPYVLLGGARIWDAQTKTMLREHTYEAKDAEFILQTVKEAGLTPFLYAQDERDAQRIYYECTADANALRYIAAQRAAGDDRFNRVDSFADKLHEKLFIITVQGAVPLLEKLLEKIQRRGLYAYLYYNSHGVCSLECAVVSKAAGVSELRRLMGAGKIVAFGDNGNDEGLFEAADVRIAVENATDGLKKQADRIIGAHDEDAVVKTIYEMEGLTWNF